MFQQSCHKIGCTVINNSFICICFKEEEPDVIKDIPEIEEGEFVPNITSVDKSHPNFAPALSLKLTLKL